MIVQRDHGNRVEYVHSDFKPRRDFHGVLLVAKMHV
jgi:hypothetical protein